MNLYLVHATTPDGDNVDWFVSAECSTHAIALYNACEFVSDFEPAVDNVRLIIRGTSHAVGVIEWDEFPVVGL